MTSYDTMFSGRCRLQRLHTRLLFLASVNIIYNCNNYASLCGNKLVIKGNNKGDTQYGVGADANVDRARSSVVLLHSARLFLSCPATSQPPSRKAALQFIFRAFACGAGIRAQALSTFACNASLLAGFLRRISTSLLRLVGSSLTRARQTLQNGPKLRLSKLNR